MIRFFDSCLSAAKEKYPKFGKTKKYLDEIMELKHQLYYSYKHKEIDEYNYLRINNELSNFVNY